MAEKPKREGFNFYLSYFDVFNELENDSDKVEFITALLERQFYGIEPELYGMAKFAYISQKHSIDKQVKGWEDKKKTKLSPPITRVVKNPTQGCSDSPKQQVQVQVQLESTSVSERESTTKSNSDELLEIDLTYEEVLDDVPTAEIWPTFDDFWELYDKKKDKKKCVTKWAKIKQSDKELIMQHVPMYLQTISEKQYQKFPYTYLNGECWNDEISVNDTKKSAQDKQLETIQKNIQAFGL